MRLFTFLIPGILVFCCQQKDNFDLYGTQFDYKQVSQVDQILSGLTSGDTAEVKLVGEIDQVCQVKGCWMTLKAGDGKSVRVTFKDYGFFVPQNAVGKKVIVDGVATVKELDEATARHYAEDAGLPYVEGAERNELSIVASGVLIEKKEGK